MTEIEDADCHWHSTGIGPMWIERSEFGWTLWRNIPGCLPAFGGWYPSEEAANRIARILAEVPDEKFEEKP